MYLESHYSGPGAGVGRLQGSEGSGGGARYSRVELLLLANSPASHLQPPHWEKVRRAVPPAALRQAAPVAQRIFTA